MLILHSICMIAVILSSYHVYKTNIGSGYTSVEALLLIIFVFQGLYRFSWMFWGTERQVVIITFLFFTF